MTTGVFRYLDPATVEPGSKPWSKVDTDAANSYARTERRRSVADLRPFLSGDAPAAPGFAADIDVAGFAVHHAPARERLFVDDAAVRNGYYAEVEALLRAKLPGIHRVVIFDHTIRKHDPAAPRQPVQGVHVDQTPGAAAARVRRHVQPAAEAENLLRGRFQLINVWRPIAHAASDFPLAVVDWRTTDPADLVAVDLLYPAADPAADDDRGKERLPDPTRAASTAGYEIRGETYSVAPSPRHKLYYVKDMAPDEAMFIKCFDSWGQGQPAGRDGIAALTPHTAFVDPGTPSDAKPRESIEVRCLVFYE
ncbi:methyltransferase [Lasiosphaeria ovina]|uniref:Methyltransferase n=1 Tax=Lasiosphaeria ovina TaxID=92902 RepID=A0AAE0NIP6_9PEZI|nr:methyltransferase [Lasiosphaeria ovina]